MIIQSEKYKEEGLIREAVKCGFGDLRLIVENEEIVTLKYIFYVCNETFRKLLCDPLFEEPLRLYDECSKESFFLLEKYYEGNEIEINEENCVDLLSICVCYNEEILLEKVNDFIANNLNENIVVGLINRRGMLLNDKMKELKDEFENYLVCESYRIMKGKMFNYLYIDSLKFIFSIGIKFDGNENDLLKLLLDYYLYNVNNIEEKYEMKRIMKRCNFKSETLNEVPADYENIIKDIKMLDDENEKYSIQFCSIPPIKNDIFYDFLMCYYPSEDIQRISFKKSDLSILKREDISNDIEVLLNSKEIKVLMLVLEICDSLRIEYDRTEYINIFDSFLDYYKRTNDEEKEKILMKKTAAFILEWNNKMIYDKMKERNGIEYLFKLLIYKNVLNEEKKKMLMNYFHGFRLNSEEYETMNKVIKDETTRKMIIYHELNRINYPENQYIFSFGDKIIIIPKINEIVDVEEVTIEPDLPNGLSIDKRSGIISGVISGIIFKGYSNVYTVTAKNMWNKITTTLKIAINPTFFIFYLNRKKFAKVKEEQRDNKKKDINKEKKMKRKRVIEEETNKKKKITIEGNLFLDNCSFN